MRPGIRGPFALHLRRCGIFPVPSLWEKGKPVVANSALPSAAVTVSAPGRDFDPRHRPTGRVRFGDPGHRRGHTARENAQSPSASAGHSALFGEGVLTEQRPGRLRVRAVPSAGTPNEPHGHVGTMGPWRGSQAVPRTRPFAVEAMQFGSRPKTWINASTALARWRHDCGADAAIRCIAVLRRVQRTLRAGFPAVNSRVVAHFLHEARPTVLRPGSDYAAVVI